MDNERGESVKRIGVGIIGVGKIALEQHIPALRATTDYALLGYSGGRRHVEGVPDFATVEDMLDRLEGLDAVVICAPPQAHFGAAKLALERGKHVLLEKPPCTSVAELDHLLALARQVHCTLYQSWHARHTTAVDGAERWLAAKAVRAGRVVWREDVRLWHPGQAWIWKTGGFGVLDAGINALSILTKIISELLQVEAARLDVPSNCETPIAVEAVLRTQAGAVIETEFDFRHRGGQDCIIELASDDGVLALTDHGTALVLDGKPAVSGSHDTEYPEVYRRFAALIGRRECDVDERPFQIVEDIFRIGRRRESEAFVE